jgi:predicted Zn-ribbon and HTH transcriptional regulator
MGNRTKAGIIHPSESRETIRQRITAILEGHGPKGHRPKGRGPGGRIPCGRSLSALEISGYAGVTEKEVHGHLEHIQRSLNKSGQKLVITPAECKQCGFVFRKRERLKRPGRCPACRSESITEPLFSIANDR